MLYLKDGWPSKPRLGAICSLVFHQTAVFLFLTQCCGGQSQMLGPSQPIVAAVGDDIMLPCRLEPAVDVTDQTVEWTRPDLSPRFVHVWRDGVELEAKKHPSYVGRGSLSINKLKHGDISLRLYKVKLSDEGTYRCFIPTLNSESSVKLVVGAVSSLIISFLRTKTDEDTNGVVLQCESNSWYPEPEVVWLDSEGNLLSAGPTETVRGPDDLYTVSSRVTVEKRHSNNFTCRVQQKDINQTRETRIYVPDDFFSAPCSSAAHITISLVVVFGVILAVVFIMWKWRQNSNNLTSRHDNRELHSLIEEEKDKPQVVAESIEIKDLDQKKENLHIQLKEVEEKCKDVIGVLNFLTDQKSAVENQMHQVILQLAERQNENQSQPERNNIISSKEKQCLDTKPSLDTVKKEFEKKLYEMDTVLQAVHFGVQIVTEKKNELDNQKEKINKQLEEIEEQRDEIQEKHKSDHSDINTKGDQFMSS
ncbi:butyrophilin subfamily 3 member A2-like isoform X4 [Dicentrarchus labrax]|uniref:Ig-like domain-containing protein n=1 Tax=Dicentrarchus labrax TaxID=13489 RepID=A0A8C4DWI3_DICLA|nr:butyrophilin subfamily 3 member A2-like isoform X4 [Dicentrarchus labrax]